MFVFLWIGVIDSPVVQQAHSYQPIPPFNNINNPKMNQPSRNQAQFLKKLQQMFTQVNSTIVDLLKNLAYIYEKHGLKYNVMEKHDDVFRLLVPFQIMSYFGMLDVQKLVQRGALERETERDRGRRSRRIQERVNEKYQTQDGVKFTKIGDFVRPERDPKPKLAHNESESQQVQPQKSNEARGVCTNKPRFSAEDEKKICNWIINLTEQGECVSKKDIMQQAQLLSNGKTGSFGWMRGFVRRNPKIMNYVQRAKGTVTRRKKFYFMAPEQPEGNEQSRQPTFNFINPKEDYKEVKKEEESESERERISVYEETSSHQDYQ